MEYLDLSLPAPAENLALDEALLDEAESEPGGRELLRLWEFFQPTVVAGRSSRLAEEVEREYCRRHGIAVLRRTSGGAAVVGGPGCLMFSLVLSLENRPAWRSVDSVHRHVLETIAAALGQRICGVRRAGISDLVVDGRKFSGNSLRVRRHCLLYHGTILYAFPLHLIAACLKQPPREPSYRRGRPHEEFLANLPLDGPTIRRLLIDAWNAHRVRRSWPQAETRRLAEEKYLSRRWTEAM